LVVVFFLIVASVFLLAKAESNEAEIIAAVNKFRSGWTAGFNEPRPGKHLMGTFLGPGPNPLPIKKIVPSESIPPTFDSRQQWPGCIGEVLNQGECGSCWAFGTGETLSDRFCIHSNSTIHLTLGELDLVSCDPTNSGCQGGWPSAAWAYAEATGIVINDCIPYNETIPTCPPAQQPCLTFVPTPPCPRKCSNGDNWQSDKHYASSSYAIGSEVSQIQTEMLKNGPVQATFTVYEDFLSYKSGVYKHLTGGEVGGHSVKIIGWGTLTSQPYWLVQNSWTSTWGDDGYFMILRGVDECGIESGIVAGLPKVN